MINDNSNSTDKITNSFFWKFAESIGIQGITFLITIVLARIVSPREYGLISLVSVFIYIALVFVQGGFNTALIQKKNASNIDYSSVLIFSTMISILLYICLFFLAPFIATFYREKELVLVLRILSITLLFGSFNSIQVAYCSSNFQFKKIFIGNFFSSIISGVIGILIALKGGGVWALVFQTLTKDVIVCLILLIISTWRPTLQFSFKSIKELVPFGSRILGANLLITGFQNIRSLLIGRKYNSESLAYYNRGNSFPQMIMSCVSTTIQSVLLPVYSEIQDDKNKIKKMVRLSVRMSCYLIFPCMFGLYAISNNLIIFLLTEKWIESAIFIKILCISYIFFPPQLAPEQAMRALGLSKINLRIELIRKAFEIIFLIISLQFGVIWVAFSAVLAALTGYIIMIYPSKRNLNYSFIEQIHDMIIPLLLSLIMAFGIYMLDIVLISFTVGVKLMIEVLCGIVIYIILSVLTKNKEYQFLLSKINKNK